jgi:catechol 2,3-dioxygenase-like lactoylglutathione lyase family enzyme
MTLLSGETTPRGHEGALFEAALRAYSTLDYLGERPTIPSERLMDNLQSCVAYIDHIQIAAPEGCELAAREFFGALLGMKEVEKPLPLRSRGGCWFQCAEQQVHVGAERDFKPNKKAHPAFAVFELDDLRRALSNTGRLIIADDTLPGTRRFYSPDPWGNRIEFVEAK